MPRRAMQVFEKEGMGEYAKQEKALLEKTAALFKKPKKRDQTPKKRRR